MLRGPNGPSPSPASADPPAAAAGPATPETTRSTAAAIPGLDGLAPTPATSARPRASTAGKPAAPRPAVASARKGASIWKSAGTAAALRDSGVSWFYTWGADSKGVTAPGVEFVPMIWGAANADAATIARAKTAGRTLLGFNEPDLAGQATMSVDTALSLWPKLQATGLRLGAPAVAAGADKAGGWLDRVHDRRGRPGLPRRLRPAALVRRRLPGRAGDRPAQGVRVRGLRRAITSRSGSPSTR